jgi:hypothetical protein
LGGDKTNEQLYQEIWEEIEHEYTGMRVVFYLFLTEQYMF